MTARNNTPSAPGSSSLGVNGENISVMLGHAVAHRIYVRNKDDLTEEPVRYSEYHVRYKVWFPEVV
jgi:hypothetical protein